MLLSLSLYHRSTCRAALGAGTFGFPSAKCISNVRHLPSLRLLVEAFLWLVPNLMSFLVGCGTRGWPRQIIEIINVIDFATPTNQCGQCKETVRLLNCRQLVQLWHTPRPADVAAYQLKLHLQFCHLLLLVVGGGGFLAFNWVPNALSALGAKQTTANKKHRKSQQNLSCFRWH